MSKRVRPATQALVKEHLKAFQKDLLDSFKTQEYKLLSKEDVKKLTKSLEELTEELINPSPDKHSIPLKDLNLAKTRARDLQKFLGLDDALQFSTIGEVFTAYLKKMEAEQKTKTEKKKYARSLAAIEQPYTDYVVSRTKKPKTAETATEDSPEEKDPIDAAAAAAAAEIAGADYSDPEDAEDPFPEAHDISADGVDSDVTEQNTLTKTSFWTPLSVTTALTPFALGALKKQALCAGLTAVGINPVVLLGVAAIGGIAGGLRAYRKNKHVVHAAIANEGGGLKGFLKATWKNVATKNTLRHAGKIALGVGAGIIIGGGISWGLSEAFSSTEFCGADTGEIKTDPSRFVEADTGGAETGGKENPVRVTAEDRIKACIASGEEGSTPCKESGIPEASRAACIDSADPKSPACTGTSTDTGSGDTTGDRGETVVEPAAVATEPEGPKELNKKEYVLNANLLLNADATDDFDFINKAIAQAETLGANDNEWISALKNKIDAIKEGMDGKDFLMSADSVRVVEAYNEVMSKALENGTLDSSEAKNALSALFTELSSSETDYVEQTAAWDDKQWYDRSHAATVKENMAKTYALAA